MAAAVLRSPDLIGDRFYGQTLAPTPLKSRRNPNPKRNSNPRSNSNPKPSCKSDSSPCFMRRRRSPAKPRDGAPVVAKPLARNLLMEQVTILKRGAKPGPAEFGAGSPKDDCVVPAAKEERGLVLGSTDRLGPDPVTVQEQIKVLDFNMVDCLYAGSAFADSPPPSSLPFPAFAKKEKKSDPATSDLRRLLRLDVLSG